MNAASIAQALGKFTTKPGGGFTACCPAHQDSNPSLSIDDADNGGILVKCWSGCTQDAIVSALKDRDLWPGKSKTETAPHITPKVVGRYDYRGADGKVLYSKERLEPGRNGKKKEFRFRHIDPVTGKSEFGHGANSHLLYNLPAVIKSKSVVVLEGERLVDLLAEWGLVGTSLDAGSASRLTPEHIEQLSGKRIVVLRDPDEPGLVYATHIANDLHGKAESVKVVLLPGLAPKEDFLEWRQKAGNDKAALLNIIKQAPEWEVAPPPTFAETAETAKTAGVNGDWPEPQPIESRIDPEPYPLDALPDTIRYAVEEVLGFVKAPAPLVVSAALSALSMSVQSHADVARANKLSGPSSIFTLTIADSGERKSTCDGFFTAAIREYEAKQTEAAKPFIQQFEAEYSSWEMKLSGVKDSIRAAAKAGTPTTAIEADLLQLQHSKPEPPRVPRIIYGDATPAALKYNLAKGWPSGAVVSSEAGIVFGGHGMKKDSAMENLATLNQLWDGTDQPTERRASESYTVKGARFTMSLMVQEATLRAFFKQDGGLARGTGFLARFLIAWPESTQGFRPFTEAPENWPHLAEFNSRISSILNQPAPITDDGALTPQMMQMAPDAKAAWIEFHDVIETMLASGGELFDIRDVASKTADNAARLACQFHVFSGDPGAISLDAFESAKRITAWHLNEARRFFGGLALPQELADAARLDSWMMDYCRKVKTDIVATTTIQHSGPSGIRTKPAIESAMKELEGLDRFRLVVDGKRKSICINPALLGGAK